MPYRSISEKKPIMRNKLALITAILAFALPAIAAEPPKPSADMKAVLDELASLGGKPIASLTPEEARKQPSPADAATKVAKARNIKVPEEVGNIENTTVTLGDHSVPVRIYSPKGDGPFPVIFYYPRRRLGHRGSRYLRCHPARAGQRGQRDRRLDPLSSGAGASFPAAHEDVFGVYQCGVGTSGRKITIPSASRSSGKAPAAIWPPQFA